MKCLSCGATEMKKKREDYHYTISGLRNVYLKNLEIEYCEKCGEEEALFPNVFQLQELIAQDLARQLQKLLPEEIRFLRVHLGLSGVDFATFMGVTPETVSRWHSGAQKMSRSSELLLRVLIISKAGPFRDYEEISQYGSVEKKTPAKRSFVAKENGWKRAA